MARRLSARRWKAKQAGEPAGAGRPGRGVGECQAKAGEGGRQTGFGAWALLQEGPGAALRALQDNFKERRRSAAIASQLKGLPTELRLRPRLGEGGKAVQRVTVSLACLVASIAFGQDACGGDVQKFCANVKPGAGRVERCLEEHEAELSTTCHANVEADKLKVKAVLAEFSEACQRTSPSFALA